VIPTKAEAKIAEEMGWLKEDQTEAEIEEESKRIEEINANLRSRCKEPPPEPDPHREGN